MVLREKTVATLVRPLLCALCLGIGNTGFAQDKPLPIVSGNTVARASTIEDIVRASLAKLLKGRFLGGELKFTTEPFDQIIDFNEPTTELRDIMLAIGLKKPLHVHVDPIQVGMTFPDSAFKIDVKKIDANEFSVRAHWSISKFSAMSPDLKMMVPDGVFPQGFAVSSKPVKIGFQKKSASIRIDLSLIAKLESGGTKFELKKLETNLSSEDRPNFYVTLGELQVNGEPLTLELESNGRVLHANEPSIRAQFQRLEPNLVQSIRSDLENVLESRFESLAASVKKNPPLAIRIETNEIIEKSPDMSLPVRKLLKNISAEFMMSYLQYVKSLDLFAVQVASRVCLDTVCLPANTLQNNIGLDDLKVMDDQDDVGLVLYSSWLQNIVHSENFQRRFREFYAGKLASPGVELGKEGVRLHVNPAANTIDLVLNLVIDIKKTTSSHSSFGEKLKRRFGDLWERLFGSGKLVHVPIEVNLHMNGFEGQGDQTILVATTELPFQADGSLKNTYRYPSNIGEMTKMVKKDFLASLQEEIKSSIPATIRIPLGKKWRSHGFEITPHKVVITKNNGVLITGSVR